MSSAGQHATRDEAFLASRAPSLSEEAAPEYPQASYYRARYYDPTTARFLTEDPIGFSSGDINVYRYSFNGPVNLDDPSGLAPGLPGFCKMAYEDCGKKSVREDARKRSRK